MKPFLISLLLISVWTCTQAQEQTDQKVFFYKDFGWKITIPENFESIVPEEQERLEKKGHRAIENTMGEKIENRAVSIFLFKNDQSNYFESNYQKLNEQEYLNYAKILAYRSQVVYSTFKDQLPTAVLDSASSKALIDGLTFNTFRTTIHLQNEVVIDVLFYSRLFGKSEFSVNIVTTDKDKQVLLLDAWRKSTFEKRL